MGTTTSKVYHMLQTKFISFAVMLYCLCMHVCALVCVCVLILSGGGGKQLE